MSIAITSPNNSRVKEAIKLNKASARRQQQRILVEGERECARALAQGFVPRQAFVCPPLLTAGGWEIYEHLQRLDAARQTWLAEVTPQVYAKLAYRQDSGGIVLVIPYHRTSLTELSPPQPAFLTIVEGVEKPGNLGAILRTADAAGVHALIVVDGRTDIFNPNVIRASLGTVFTVPVVETDAETLTAWLRERDVPLIVAAPDARLPYTQANLCGACAIALGSEAAGISPALRSAAHTHVYIPMLGQADSLNLASSTAILLYEVIRQRTRA